MWAAGSQQWGEPGRHVIVLGTASGPGRAGLFAQGLNTILEVSGDTIGFLPAGLKWRAEVAGSGSALRAIAVSDELITAACGDYIPNWRAAVGERRPRIVETADQLWRELGSANERRPDPLVLRMMLRLIASTFGGLPRRPDDGWLPAAVLGRLSLLVASDALPRLSVPRLAADAGLGVSAFSRGFRGSTGLTPGEFLTEVRMNRVALLLASTEMRLPEIAASVGLASVPHLIHQFRSRFATSAGRYRAALRQASRVA